MYYNFQHTRKKKTRILGMSIPQVLILAVLLLTQGIILVIILKLFVFTTSEKSGTVEVATATPTQVIVPTASPTPELTSTPTPIPDFSSVALTMEDLPVGFAAAPPESEYSQVDFNKVFEGIDLHPLNGFALLEIQTEHFVCGWTFKFTTTLEEEDFDALIQDPTSLLDAYAQDWGVEGMPEWNQLPRQLPIGESSSAWTVVLPAEEAQMRSDIVLFRHDGVGAIVASIYDNTQTPVIGIWELARRLDANILVVMTSGPIPTPRHVDMTILAEVKLSLTDLPEGFQEIPESELPFGTVTESVQLAGKFGFFWGNKYDESAEVVIGGTFALTSTIEQAGFDQLLVGNTMLDTLYPSSPNQIKTPLDIGQTIGDRSSGIKVIITDEDRMIRSDVIYFRRGQVGVFLVHIYTPGRRSVSVEDLAVKLDEKIKTFFSP